MPENSTDQERTPPKKAATRRPQFEGVALLLLSLATVGTAWCSYEAATWAGMSQRLTNQSAAASRQAVTDQLGAYQMALLDVLLFSQHINARALTNEPLARFYAERFRGEAKTAFAAWMATQPFENPNAPPHPFVNSLYQPRLLDQARQAEAESQRLWQQGGEAGRTSRAYVLITVLLACALFFAGTASKFETTWIRLSIVALGLSVFLFAVQRLASLPMQI